MHVIDGEVAAYFDYAYHGDQVIAEYSSTGADPQTPMRTFVYGAYIDEPIAMDTASGARYYFVSDGTRSVSLLLGETEPGVWAVVERYAYEDFGEAIVLDAAGLELSASAFGNPYFFQGRRYDAELGLYYYRNRYYDPIHGRFTSRDPLGFWGDPANMGNPYTFLANNPWSFLDPWGLCGMTREQLERQLQELLEGKDGDSLAAFLDDLWDNKEAQTEIIGVFIPLGDLARAGIALDEGEYWEAVENLFGIVPIVGDGAKLLSKGGRKLLGTGFDYSDEVMMGVKQGAKALPRGGTYLLRDPQTGRVMRSGRTNNLDRRMAEHARDPNTRHLDFDIDRRTDVYSQQRGREQVIHDYHNPPMDYIRPISAQNPHLEEYLREAKTLE